MFLNPQQYQQPNQAVRKLTANQYKIIWESNPIPSSPIVINKKKLSPEFISKLQKALIDAPIGLADVNGTKSAGYTLGKDVDFEEIRQTYFRFKSVNIPTK